MSQFFFASILLSVLGVVYAEIEFQSWHANQLWHPTFILLGISGSCTETVSIAKFQLWQWTTNSWRDWNKEHDEPEGCTFNCVHRYAWDYSEIFDTPLSVRLIKSNNEQLLFWDIIQDYNTSTIWSTGKEFCPTPAPTNDPSPLPTNKPTNYPNNNPSEQPTHSTVTDNPTISPSEQPTYIPTISPTSNATAKRAANGANIPSNFPTVEPTANPIYIPTLEPTFNASTAQPTQGRVLAIEWKKTTQIYDGEVMDETRTTDIIQISDTEIQTLFASVGGTFVIVFIMGLFCLCLVFCMLVISYIYYTKPKKSKQCITSNGSKENISNQDTGNKEYDTTKEINKGDEKEGIPAHLGSIKISSIDSIQVQTTNGAMVGNKNNLDIDEYINHSALPKSDGEETDDDATDNDDDMYNDMMITNDGTRNANHFHHNQQQLMQKIGSIGSDGSGIGVDLNLLRISSIISTNSVNTDNHI